MKLSSLLFIAILFFASCSSNNNLKKASVFGRGSIDINSDSKTITVKDDGSADDKTTQFYESSPVNITIKKPSGDVQVSLPEKGLYVINAKRDTVIGIYQNYDSKKASDQEFSQDDLKKSIDSLIGLTENKNITKENRNFFLLPFTAVKITDNTDATIIPPFQQMLFTEQANDKKPEVYRFYNISEIRETLAKLQSFAAPAKKGKANIKTQVIKDKSEQF